MASMQRQAPKIQRLQAATATTQIQAQLGLGLPKQPSGPPGKRAPRWPRLSMNDGGDRSDTKDKPEHKADDCRTHDSAKKPLPCP